MSEFGIFLILLFAFEAGSNTPLGYSVYLEHFWRFHTSSPVNLSMHERFSSNPHHNPHLFIFSLGSLSASLVSHQPVELFIAVLF